MSKRLEITVTVPLPADHFEAAKVLHGLDDVRKLIVDKVSHYEGSTVGHTIKSERMPRNRDEAPAAPTAD